MSPAANVSCPCSGEFEHLGDGWPGEVFRCRDCGLELRQIDASALVGDVR